MRTTTEVSVPGTSTLKFARVRQSIVEKAIPAVHVRGGNSDASKQVADIFTGPLLWQ